jgi:hypothetical protein
VLSNRSQKLGARFTTVGVRVHSGEASIRLSLRGYGYGRELRALTPVAARAKGNRVVYRHGALDEWYVNGPLGLEEGFTLRRRPGRPGSGRPLTISLALAGNLRPVLEPERRGLSLVAANGRTAVRYRGLAAVDARGRSLYARLELRRGRLLIRVADSRARYPVTIDPFFQAAKLLPSDGAGGVPYGDLFGYSIAVSGDTIVVGARYESPGGSVHQGAAYVFVKPARGWSSTLTESAKLTNSDGAAGDQMGFWVSIAGSTIVVGAPLAPVGPDVDRGAAYVFLRPTTGWSGSLTENAKLTASDGAFLDLFADSVSISSDTNTIVAGARLPTVGGHPYQGAAYVFVKPGGGWSGHLTENAKLTASDGATEDQFGLASATTGDLVVVGAPFAGATKGAAYVFVKPSGGWAGHLTENAKLNSSDGGVDALGWAVTILGDTVFAGGPEATVGANQYQGAVYAYTKPVGGWSGTLSENARLTAPDGASLDELGVSLASSGATVVTGSAATIAGKLYQGAVYIYQRPVPGWFGNLTPYAKVIASDGQAGDYLGTSVGISGTTIAAGARTAVVGGRNQGAAYVFCWRSGNGGCQK